MQSRNPVLVALFSVITLGIYALYWLYVVVRDVNAAVDRDKRAWSIIWLIFPPLILLALLAMEMLIIFLNVYPLNRLLIIVTLLVVSICILAMMIIPFLWFYRFAKSLEAYTNGGIKFTENYIIFLITFFLTILVVWYGVTQYEINQYLRGETSGNPPQPASV